jgi:hypothetical protein
MPPTTENLDYKITFDTSELASKLGEIRTQIDTALGAQAFTAAGADNYPFSGMLDISMGSNALTAAQQGMANFTADMNNVQGMFQRFTESSRLGYTKFSHELELGGLTSGAAKYITGNQYFGESQANALLEDKGTFGRGIQALTGGAWAPNWSMTQGEFKLKAEQAFVESVLEPSWGGFATSVGLGAMSGGLVGAGIGAVAYGAQSLAHTLATPYYHNKMVSNYVRDSSSSFLSGRFGKSESDVIADQLAKNQFTDKGYNRQEIDNVIKEFTQSGGYDTVTSAEEYQRATSTFFEQHRKVMQTLKLTSENAARMMGEVSSNLGVSDFTGFASQVNSLSTITGMTTQSSMNFMSMSGEMARGSGMDMLSAATGTAGLLEQAKTLARRGVITPEDMRQQGGLQNIALSMSRSAMNYSTSPLGQLNAAATLGSPNGMMALAGMGINDRLGAAANNLNNPSAFLTMYSRQNQMRSEMGPQLLAMDEATMYASEANMIMGRPLSNSEFYGYLRANGMDDGEAKRMTAIARTDVADVINQKNRNVSNAIANNIPNPGSVSSRFWNSIGNGLSESYYENIGIPAGNISEYIGDKYERVVDFADKITGGVFNSGPDKSTVAVLFSTDAGRNLLKDMSSVKRPGTPPLTLEKILGEDASSIVKEGGALGGLMKGLGLSEDVKGITSAKKYFAESETIKTSSNLSKEAYLKFIKNPNASLEEKIQMLKDDPKIKEAAEKEGS